MGGDDEGPNPYQLLLAGLVQCTAATLRMYANRKGWELGEVRVRARLLRTGDGATKVERIERTITVTGDLTAEQKERLAEIADRTPVTRTLWRGWPSTPPVDPPPLTRAGADRRLRRRAWSGPRSAEVEAAVDQHHLAGDIGRPGQAEDHLGHVLGRGRPLQRRLGVHELADEVPVGRPRGVDQPGGHGVDPDVGPRTLASNRVMWLTAAFEQA